jgi:hypothetical protein
MEKPHTSNKYYRLWLFWVGIIATIAYRAIIVMNHYSDFWVEVFWYVGTIGFIWYFAHRYRVANDREDIIKERKLVNKIEKNKPLSKDDRDVILYILKGLKSSKSQWNYIAIFVFSIIALIYATYVNIIKFLY